jgi:hypothetical protein
MFIGGCHSGGGWREKTVRRFPTILAAILDHAGADENAAKLAM